MRFQLSSKSALIASLVALLGLGACKAKPKESAGETKSEVAAGEAKAESDAAPPKPLAPERFTLSEVNQILLKLRACVDEDSSLAHMTECGCLSDLSLSNEPQPEDPEAYCRDFAAKTIATSKLPEEEQMKQEYLLAAKDVPAPGSTGLFSFAAPCMMNAFKKKSKNLHNVCVCAAHALANGMVDHDVKTTEKVVKAMEAVGEDMKEAKVCQPQ